MSEVDWMLCWTPNIHHTGASWMLYDGAHPVLKELKNGLWKATNDAAIRIWKRVSKR